MKIPALFIPVLLSLSVSAQSGADDLRTGNERYRQQKYADAEASYTEAGKKEPADLTSKYNKASALYRQDKQSAAMRELDDLSFKSLDNSLKAKALYNKGVILSGQSRLEESIEAYKTSLRLDPANKQARENLQKALQELQKKQDQPQPQKPKPQPQKKQEQPSPQPRMDPKEAEQRLKLLEQKEKNVQQRLQQERSRQASSTGKDW